MRVAVDHVKLPVGDLERTRDFIHPDGHNIEAVYHGER
jgi:hypothetical protein